MQINLFQIMIPKDNGSLIEWLNIFNLSEENIDGHDYKEEDSEVGYG